MGSGKPIPDGYCEVAVQVFVEQFTLNDGKAELKAHPGCKILLNPSDRETEIGHKGVGYQVQITETCSAANDVQLITAALPQGGSQSDMATLPTMVDELKKNKCSPEKFYADGGYGSDDNFVYSAANGVDLLSPTHPIPKDKVGLDESKFDKKGFMIQCPAGKSPMLKKFKNGSYRAIFHITACGNCPLKEKCRSEKCGKQNRQFKYKESDIRTLERREIEKHLNSKKTIVSNESR